MRLKFIQRIIDLIRNKVPLLDIFADKFIGIERAKNIRTLVIGSSHLASCYRAIDGEYNLAIPSQDLYYSWHLYDKYNNPEIKNIIFSFSVFTPGHEQIKSPFAAHCILYKELFKIPYRSQELADAKKLFKEEKRYIKSIAKYLAKQKLPENFNGTTNIFKPVKSDCKERRQFYALKHYKYAQKKPSQMEFFFKLLNATKENNQNLYIIIPPATKDYKEVLPDSKFLFEELFESVKNYNHVKIFDYYNTDLFDDNDFLDGDHLNLQGGEKLTSMFRKDVINS